MFREFTIEAIAKMIGGIKSMAQLELVRGVSINSETTKPGDLFFALKGTRTDGHGFVDEALANGAVAAVVRQGRPCAHAVEVRDTLFALGELARHYRNHFPVRAIGITGTNGTTTVKNLVAAILSRHHKVVSTDKNYNSLIGLPLTILRVSGDEDYLVLEMGTNAPGEIKRLCDIARPEIGMITNVGPGHLEGLDSLEGIRKEKLSLINALPSDGIGVVGEGVAPMPRGNNTVFSASMLEEVDISERGSHFSFRGRSFTTGLLGMGNVYNCLAAICLTAQMGIEYETQREAVAEAKPEPGRMEPNMINGILIIDDTYNANPVSMKAALDFVARSNRRKIVVLGDMLELGEQSEILHQEVGVYAEQRADLLITHGDKSKLYGGYHFSLLNELLNFLGENIRGGEIILIKASRALLFERIVNALARRLR